MNKIKMTVYQKRKVTWALVAEALSKENLEPPTQWRACKVAATSTATHSASALFFYPNKCRYENESELIEKQSILMRGWI